MLRTLILDNDLDALSELRETIRFNFPQFQVSVHCHYPKDDIFFINKYYPDLILLNLNLYEMCPYEVLPRISKLDNELIIISREANHAIEAFKFSVSGFVLKPIKTEELVLAIMKAENNFRMKQEYKRNEILVKKLINESNTLEKIGIPTIKGYDFIPIRDIIRCEGLQKYTRIVTKSKSNIISSKNLGEFRKQLEQYGFFSPHKSHLINLNFIFQYYKEGIIVMVDESQIPIARRRKQDFLSLVNHF